MTSSSPKLLEQLKQARKALKKSKDRKKPRRHQSEGLDPLFLKATSQSLPSPKRLLFVRSDSYGDLVLFVPALAWLAEVWPDARVGVIFKKAYADIAPLLPSGIECMPIDGDPNTNSLPTPEAKGEIESAIRDFSPDLIVAHSYEKTWFHAIAALAARGVSTVSLGPVEFAADVAQWLKDQNVDPSSLYKKTIPVERTAHELAKSASLLAHLTELEPPALVPGIRLTEDSLDKARSILRDLKLTPGKYLLCNPAGVANIALKRWSTSNFAKVIQSLAKRSGYDVLLCAHSSEREIIERILSKVGGAKRIRVWLGSTGDFPVVAALASFAIRYIGNDTSTLHTAEAVGTPVIGIYGGGTWPRFSPSLGASVAIVHPLPCFGCSWDCHLGDAPCVRLIEPDDVVRAAEKSLRSETTGTDAPAQIFEVSHWSRDVIEQVAKSRQVHENLSRESRARQQQLFANAALIQLQRERLEEQSAPPSLPSSGTEAALRAELERHVARVAFVEQDSAARLEQIHKLTELVHAKNADGVQLREQISLLNLAVRDRDALINDLKIQLEDRQAQLLAKANALETAQASLQKSDTASDERKSLMEKLQSAERDADDLRKHVQTLTSIVRNHESDGIELRRQLQLLGEAVKDRDQKRESLEIDSRTRFEEMRKVSSRLESALTENENLRLRLSDADSRLTREITEHLAAKDGLEQRLAAAHIETQRLGAELDVARSGQSTLAERLRIIESDSLERLNQIKTLTLLVKQQEQDAFELRRQISQLNEHARQRDSDLAITNTQLADASEARLRGEARIVDLESQLKTLEEFVAHLESQLLFKQKALDELNDQVSRFTHETSTQHSALAAERERAEALRINLQRIEAERDLARTRLADILALFKSRSEEWGLVKNAQWTKIGKTIGVIGEAPELDLPANIEGTAPVSQQASGDTGNMQLAEVEKYRSENQRLSKEIAVLRSVNSSALHQAPEAPRNHPNRKEILPKTKVTDSKVVFSVDRCEHTPEHIFISGWAFSPLIDSRDATHWLWLCSEKEQRLVPTEKTPRPDVREHFSAIEIDPALPLGDSKRLTLDQSGFCARIEKTDLIASCSYHLEIQVQGPDFSVRMATPAIITV